LLIKLILPVNKILLYFTKITKKIKPEKNSRVEKKQISSDKVILKGIKIYQAKLGKNYSKKK